MEFLVMAKLVEQRRKQQQNTLTQTVLCYVDKEPCATMEEGQSGEEREGRRERREREKTNFTNLGVTPELHQQALAELGWTLEDWNRGSKTKGTEFARHYCTPVMTHIIKYFL